MLLEILLVVLGILILLALIIGGWIIGLYNTMVTAVQDINNMWSDVKTEYQRRADLFMNLVETTKVYAKFEKDTLTQVIAARGGNFGKTNEEQMKKLKGLDNLFGKLMVVFERYPKLKAVKEYDKLMEEIRITEDRINVARTDFNAIVRDYNVMIKEFPARYFARKWNYNEWKYFENEPTTDKAPKIDMKI